MREKEKSTSVVELPTQLACFSRLTSIKAILSRGRGTGSQAALWQDNAMKIN